MLFACPTFWPPHVLVVLGLGNFRTSPYSQLLMALLIVILVGHRACGGFLTCAFGFTSTATSEWMQVLENLHCQSGTLA